MTSSDGAPSWRGLRRNLARYRAASRSPTSSTSDCGYIVRGSTDERCRSDRVDLLAGYRSGTLPVKPRQAALDRIDAHDGAVNAFCLRDDDAALGRGEGVARRAGRPERRGPARRRPIFDQGHPLRSTGPPCAARTRSTRRDRRPDDAPPSPACAPAGAVIIGKTTTPEFGWKGVTDSPLTGVTAQSVEPGPHAGRLVRRQRGRGRTGHGPAARWAPTAAARCAFPPRFTATVTIKPTYGRVPALARGAFGRLATRADDPHRRRRRAAARRTGAARRPATRGRSRPSPRPKRPRVGRPGRGSPQPALGYVARSRGRHRVATAVEVFAALGAHVEEVDPGFADPIEAFETLWYAARRRRLSRIGPEQRARMDPALSRSPSRARDSARRLPRAMAARNELGIRMAPSTTATTCCSPDPADRRVPVGSRCPRGWPTPRWMTWTPFSYPSTSASSRRPACRTAPPAPDSRSACSSSAATRRRRRARRCTRYQLPPTGTPAVRRSWAETRPTDQVASGSIGGAGWSKGLRRGGHRRRHIRRLRHVRAGCETVRLHPRAVAS